jgi:UDP-N-acetylglucosamine pyrophosphorylase
MTSQAKPRETVITKLNEQLSPHLKLDRRHSKSQSAFNYDNTSSNLAATTMRNELKKLVDTAPPEARDVSSRRRQAQS